MSSDDFGQYLSSVRERDIDLLLLEEFHCSTEFTVWFCNKLGLDDVEFDGAWHSVSDVDGETDLLLRIRRRGIRVGVFIENKVRAPEQDSQDLRYHQRARRACEQGKIDDFVTSIIAPNRYLKSMPIDREYTASLSFEEIEVWFQSRADRRAIWRAEIVREAIEQNRRSSTMLVSSTRTRFFEDYWLHLRANHPELLMNMPSSKGNKSNWVKFKGRHFPKGVLLTHKIDQCVMELGFSRTNLGDIEEAVVELPESAIFGQRGKTAVVQIDVPEIDKEVSFSQQVGVVEVALDAAYKLAPLADCQATSRGLSTK
tara:strand:+ start:45148 stop:46086 length:939 start_codon:yes stop_codon:yes gene_type:complete